MFNIDDRGDYNSVITSKQNEQIRFTKKLRRRRYRDQTGLFIAEGLRLVESILSTNNILELYYTDQLVKTDRGRSLLASCVNKEIKTCECSDQVFGELSMTENAQGVLAVVNQPRPLLDWHQQLKQGIILVVDRIQDPGNLGTILRTALAAGIDGIWLLQGTVDPFNPKVIRASMGAIMDLKFNYLTNDQCISLVREHDLELVVTDLEAGVKYFQQDFHKPLALVVGNEANGVDPYLIKAAQKSIYIPTTDAIESLNVAVATSVLLYEIVRQRSLE